MKAQRAIAFFDCTRTGPWRRYCRGQAFEYETREHAFSDNRGKRGIACAESLKVLAHGPYPVERRVPLVLVHPFLAFRIQLCAPDGVLVPAVIVCLEVAEIPDCSYDRGRQVPGMGANVVPSLVLNAFALRQVLAFCCKKEWIERVGCKCVALVELLYV